MKDKHDEKTIDWVDNLSETVTTISLADCQVSVLASRHTARKYRDKIYYLLDLGYKNVFVDFDNVISATHSFIDELIAVNITFDNDKKDKFFESVKLINVNDCIADSIQKAILIRKMSLTNHFK